MTVLFLIIIIWQGEVRYRIEEFSDFTQCRMRKVEVELLAKENQAQIIRSECFDVGQVAKG